MDTALKVLIDRMPPPPNPRDQDVEWVRLENRIGLQYPDSYKEFVTTYGGTVWCDNWCPFYTTAHTDKDVDEFLASVSQNLEPMRGNMVQKGSKEPGRLNLPLYPEGGGLFPFMVDYSSGLYCWKTSDRNPNKWPVICWMHCQVTELRGISIAGMFLEWLERKPRMMNLWEDVKKYPPERICLE